MSSFTMPSSLAHLSRRRQRLLRREQSLYEQMWSAFDAPTKDALHTAYEEDLAAYSIALEDKATLDAYATGTKKTVPDWLQRYRGAIKKGGK